MSRKRRGHPPPHYRCACIYIQLDTPKVVAIAVKILMMTLMIVFQVSVLIFSLID